MRPSLLVKRVSTAKPPITAGQLHIGYPRCFWVGRRCIQTCISLNGDAFRPRLECDPKTIVTGFEAVCERRENYSLLAQRPKS